MTDKLFSTFASALTQNVLPQITRIFVGYSGGVDSTVLLPLAKRYCVEKAIPLTALHIHHGLLPQATAWLQHCQDFCTQQAIACQVHQLTPPAQFSDGLEEWARDARYQYFTEQLTEAGDVLLLGHHMDDQLETLLFRLFRGTGVAGLGGMPEVRPLGAGNLCRPLLTVTKEDLMQYANTAQLSWIEDDSNLSERHSRNYIRQALLPVIKARWPAVARQVAQTVRHCQEAQECLTALAALDAAPAKLEQPQIDIQVFNGLSRVRQKNILRTWLTKQMATMLSTKQLNVLLDEVIFAKPDAKPKLQIGPYQFWRQRGILYFCLERK